MSLSGEKPLRRQSMSRITYLLLCWAFFFTSSYIFASDRRPEGLKTVVPLEQKRLADPSDWALRDTNIRFRASDSRFWDPVPATVYVYAST